MANNNTQMRRVIRRNDQRDKLGKAYTDVCLALDAVSDTMACSGSEVVASWLSPAVLHPNGFMRTDCLVSWLCVAFFFKAYPQ